MQTLLLFLLLSCSSFLDLNESNNEDKHISKKVTRHQMSLNFDSQRPQLGVSNEEKLNKLSEKIIGTGQEIKKITIFSNPNDLKLSPKEALINFDRASNVKRFLERDLHSKEVIEIITKENSPLSHNKNNTDILILVEYL